MCMFCAALPMVVGATAVAQGEERKKLNAAKVVKQANPQPETNLISPKRQSSQPLEIPNPPQSRRGRFALSPMRINQIGALAFVTLLIASGFYHTHMPS